MLPAFPRGKSARATQALNEPNLPPYIGSSFQNFFVSIQRHFFRLTRQQDVYAPGSIAADWDLAETNHAFAEVDEYGNYHGKMLIDLALREGHVQLHFAAVRRSELIIEVVSGDLRAVDPLVEKPVQAAIPL